MASVTSVKGKSWRKDFPDSRDHTPFANELSPKQKAGAAKKPVSEVLKGLIEKNSSGQRKDSFRAKEDLRQRCPFTENQKLNPCITHAGAGFFKLNLVL